MDYYKTNFNDFDLGIFTGQQGWFNPAPGGWKDPTVETAIIFSGREVHAATSPAQPAGCARFFDGFGAGGVQWFKGSFASIEALPFLVTQISDVGGAFISVLFQFGGLLAHDEILVNNGGILQSTGVTFGASDPHIVKAKIDFTTKKWDAYVDDIPKLLNLDLQDPLINDIKGFMLYALNNQGTKVMGSIFVGDFDPDSVLKRRRRLQASRE